MNSSNFGQSPLNIPNLGQWGGQQPQPAFNGWGNTMAYQAYPNAAPPMGQGTSFLGGMADSARGMLGGNTNGLGAAGWGNLLQGAGAIGSAFLGSQMLKQGKKEFKFNKGMAQRNLANQAQLINTGIERRARSNAHSLGLEGSDADNFIKDRKQRESVRGTI